VFPEDSIFRIDHFLGKEAIMNVLYFRFASTFLEPIWNRNYVASVQVTLSEDFGVGSRGSFYETAGCLRDVVENHLFQIVALLAMEPPSDRDFGAVQTEKAKVFQAMRPLKRGAKPPSFQQPCWCVTRSQATAAQKLLLSLVSAAREPMSITRVTPLSPRIASPFPDPQIFVSQ
jgi:hypothetical protein